MATPPPLLRCAIDRVHAEAEHTERSQAFERFRVARRGLGNAGWACAGDGGCGLGLVVVRFMFGFPRAAHAFELTPTEVAWEVDGDGGLESVGGFVGKGGAAQKANQGLALKMAAERQPLALIDQRSNGDEHSSARNKNAPAAARKAQPASFSTPLGVPPLPATATSSSRRRPPVLKACNESAWAGGALVLIYRFYCRVQNPGSKLARRLESFDEIAQCNAVLSFLGLVTFLRDFDVVADLLLTADVASLWRGNDVESSKPEASGQDVASDVARSGLDFTQFLNMLTKVALITFPRDVLSSGKDVSEDASKRSSPPFEACCLRFAGYCRLNDANYARKILATRGAQSCERINNPGQAAAHSNGSPPRVEGGSASNRELLLEEARRRVLVNTVLRKQEEEEVVETSRRAQKARGHRWDNGKGGACDNNSDDDGDDDSSDDDGSNNGRGRGRSGGGGGGRGGWGAIRALVSRKAVAAKAAAAFSKGARRPPNLSTQPARNPPPSSKSGPEKSTPFKQPQVKWEAPRPCAPAGLFPMRPFGTTTHDSNNKRTTPFASASAQAAVAAAAAVAGGSGTSAVRTQRRRRQLDGGCGVAGDGERGERTLRQQESEEEEQGKQEAASVQAVAEMLAPGAHRLLPSQLRALATFSPSSAFSTGDVSQVDSCSCWAPFVFEKRRRWRDEAVTAGAASGSGVTCRGPSAKSTKEAPGSRGGKRQQTLSSSSRVMTTVPALDLGTFQRGGVYSVQMQVKNKSTDTVAIAASVVDFCGGGSRGGGEESALTSALREMTTFTFSAKTQVVAGLKTNVIIEFDTTRLATEVERSTRKGRGGSAGGGGGGGNRKGTKAASGEKAGADNFARERRGVPRFREVFGVIELRVVPVDHTKPWTAPGGKSGGSNGSGGGGGGNDDGGTYRNKNHNQIDDSQEIEGHKKDATTTPITNDPASTPTFVRRAAEKKNEKHRSSSSSRPTSACSASAAAVDKQRISKPRHSPSKEGAVVSAGGARNATAAAAAAAPGGVVVHRFPVYYQVASGV